MRAAMRCRVIMRALMSRTELPTDGLCRAITSATAGGMWPGLPMKPSTRRMI
jgi:hypothetical protein